ncbi:MAG: hypothetical protein ACI9VM_000243 [Candidatus Azotimanducaceae bacterium]|jgi:hypothetical protein
MYYYFGLGLIVLLVIWLVGSYVVIRNLEEPSYTVLEKRKGYEVRKYDPYIIAETEVTGSYSDSLNEGFRVIADYIFGNNTSKTSIAMTTPVLENKSESIAMTVPVINTSENEQVRIISFVLPSKYTLETLPEPNNSKVRLTEVKARTVVALRFNWYAMESRAAKKQALLEALIAKDGLVVNGPVQVAQYNPPFSMPLMRRNEIIIPIADVVEE